MNKEKAFEELIRRRLLKASINFETQKAIGGVKPDFVVYTPDGRLIIIETKTWPKRRGITTRAAQQAKLYEKAIGADRAFIVVEDLKHGRVSEGVVTPDELIEALTKEFGRQPRLAKNMGTEPQKKAKAPKKPQKTIFAAMPFDPRYEDVYFFAMAYAAESIGATCQRVDQAEFSSDIVQKIHEFIAESVGVIADLSEAKPNVLYEAGYAHALERPCIHICSTPLKEMPFDVSHWNTIEYKIGQIHVLKEKLAKRLKAVI
jgi:hypothetical protein